MGNFFKVLIVILVVIAIGAIFFLVAIPAFVDRGNSAAPGRIVPAVSSLATSTSFLEGARVYENARFGYHFKYPAEKIAYESVTESGVRIPATSRSSIVNIARDESRPTSHDAEIFSVVVYTDERFAAGWIERYYASKSEIEGNKIFLYEGYPARDVIGAGSSTSPARIIIVEKDGYIVTIEQSVESDFLRSIFSTFEFIRGTQIRQRDTHTSEGAHDSLTSAETEVHAIGQHETFQHESISAHRFDNQERHHSTTHDLSFITPPDYGVVTVSVTPNNEVRLDQNGSIIFIAPPGVALTPPSPEALLITLDRRPHTLEEWYQNFYEAKTQARSINEFLFGGYRSWEIIGSGTLTSPHRTVAIERGGVLTVIFQIVNSPTLESILSSISFR